MTLDADHMKYLWISLPSSSATSTSKDLSWLSRHSPPITLSKYAERLARTRAWALITHAFSSPSAGPSVALPLNLPVLARFAGRPSLMLTRMVQSVKRPSSKCFDRALGSITLGDDAEGFLAVFLMRALRASAVLPAVLMPRSCRTHEIHGASCDEGV
jgi:hypothetical protein